MAVPVLIRVQSGLAQVLCELEIDNLSVVDRKTRDTATHRANERWVDAIQRVLDTPAPARNRARELRGIIAATTR